MKNNFKTKNDFKNAFLSKLNETYKVDLKESTVYQRYNVLAHLLDESLEDAFQKTNQYVNDHQMKKTIYFSMEFLMGRLITNNLQNSGYYDIVKEGFNELGIDLNEVEHAEVDAGLGNGGLGRLAACFLDSSASLALPLYGNSLRYKHGFFVQEIKDHKQVEHKDPWLNQEFIWESRDEENAIEIPLFGYVEHTKLINPVWIKAVPYDVKVVGDQNGVVTSLRLWSTEPSDKQKHQDEEYMKIVDGVDDQLYPDDSTEDGKTIRLLQSYIFSAAGVKHAIKEHKALGRSIKEFHKYYTSKSMIHIQRLLFLN